MEMMIVLLIMSIIAAATAPIVSKKMSKSASSSSGSPWVFIDTKGNAAFNMAGKDVTAVIGASKVPTGVNTRLYIDCGSSNSQLTFGKGDEVMQVTADPSGRAGISSDSIQPNSVAIGGNQSLSGSSTVTIGQNASTTDTGATAIGASAKATGNSSFAAGSSANASGRNSISIGSDSKASGTWSVAIGGTDVYTGAGGKVTQATGSHNVAIGTGAQTESSSTIAIGDGASATGPEGIAIGSSAEATGNKSGTGGSIALGKSAKAQHKDTIAIGRNAVAQKEDSIAIGQSARALHDGSTAIGQGAVTTQNSQIALGRTQDTVYIKGNLIVDGNVALGVNTWKHVFVRTYDGFDGGNKLSHIEFDTGNRQVKVQGTGWSWNYQGHFTNGATNFSMSDRRVKNVGAKYTEGLEALKKLDFYHFTFKKDETKTPHVGVMAQDLQKVFPKAVMKGEDGFLRIRMEDMFYAVINAIKELDLKNSSQDKIIEAQQKRIEELEKRLDELSKRNN